MPADAIISEAFAVAGGPRNILVYAPMAYSTPHFETDLEIAQRHVDLGDHVDLVLCDAELPSCQLNPHHELQRCVQCVSRNLQGVSQLSPKVRAVGLLATLTREDHVEIERLPPVFEDQRALRRFSLGGFDAGLAVLSSLIDFTRSPEIDTREHAALIHRTLVSAVSTFLAMRRMLAAKGYDRAYIYNGRWSIVRSAVRACEASRVPYYTHERGADLRRFALFKDTLPHDKIDFQVQAGTAWSRAGAPARAQEVARAFFDERRQRVERNWFSFTKQQEEGRVPGDWGRECRRLVLFTSSEFEFAAIGEAATGRIYATQVEGVRRIAPLLAQRCPEAHLWVRVHPNDDNPASFRRWTEAAAAHPNVTLILPGESVDSYAMLDGAERVLTFGSTLGIEATYWGKASICCDDSFYDGLDAQYEAADEGELIALLSRTGLPPKPRENALKFGYHLNTFGGEFLHFSTERISDYDFQSPFRGRCLKPDYNDLRQRLLELFKAGGLTRAARIAQVLLAFNPADTISHSVLILCLVRSGQLDGAVLATEAAAASLAPAQLDSVLRVSAAPLVGRLRGHAAAADAAALLHRAASALCRAPAFAGLGRELAALAAPQSALKPAAAV